MARQTINKRHSRKLRALMLPVAFLAFVPFPLFGRQAVLTKNVSLEMHSDLNPGGRQVYPAGTEVEAAPAEKGQFLVAVGDGPKFLVPASSLRFDSDASSPLKIPPPPNVAPIQPKTASQPSGEDLKTLSGQVYKNARIARVEPDGITVFFVGGAVKIPFKELPDAIKAKYNLTPEKAAAFSHAEELAAQQDEIAAQQATRQEHEDKKRSLAEDLESMTLSLREVESDMTSHIGRDFVVHGTIDISATYLWGYGDAQETHYAFTVSDGRQTLYCYGPKGSLAPLRWKLLDGGPQKGRFVVKILRNRFLKGQTGLTAEILGPGHLDAELAPY